MSIARMAKTVAFAAKLMLRNQLENLAVVSFSQSMNDFVLFVSESCTVAKVSVTAACAISIISGSITRFFRARRKILSRKDGFFW